MIKTTQVHFNIMQVPVSAFGYDRKENEISYYDLLLTKMHNLGRYTATGFIPYAAEFGLTPMSDETQVEVEVLKATKDFLNFWIEYGYVGYEELAANIKAIDTLAWDLTGGLMQFRFTTKAVNGELPKAFFYVLNEHLMRNSFAAKM